MFVSDRFVYLELHKTGCTHIRNILKELLGGEFIGKHNQADTSLFDDKRIFLGSIRDPWEWYISLWAYGCDNKGSVFGSVTRERELSMRGLGWKNNPFSAFLTLLSNISREPQKWRDTYKDVEDPEAFRTWLYMIHDTGNLMDIGEGYGASPVSAIAGLLTFRYLKLFCCKNDEPGLPAKISFYDHLENYEKENCFIDKFIRNENLESDLFSILDAYYVNIEAEKKSEILSRPKTNVSSRNRGVDYYYDLKSENLVHEKERLIINKFGYVPPSDRKTISDI